MFTTLSKDEFLDQYWQQKPFVFRGEFKDAAGIVDGDELAGLAYEEAVESRIICGSGQEGPWSCQQGPFVDFDYNSLGTTNWTLLVQGVDQWDDEVRALLNSFDFLPSWRLEDVMASFAPTGGGVGPHFDYYDVFLVQVAGRRRWQTGQNCDDRTALQDNKQVKLLQEFDTTASHDLDPGDAIYIPAGIAHWGTSLSDDCVTLSVGFRAPSDREILAEAFEILGPQLSDAKRFRDSKRSIDEDCHKINAAAEGYAQSVLDRLDRKQLKAALSEAFGRLVTDTRYCSFSEDTTVWTSESVARQFSQSTSVPVVHPAHCRMAYSESQLFVNGEAYSVAPAFARDLCSGVLNGPLDSQELDLVALLLNEDMIAFS